jgi:hypothetical protein
MRNVRRRFAPLRRTPPSEKSTRHVRKHRYCKTSNRADMWFAFPALATIWPHHGWHGRQPWPRAVRREYSRVAWVVSNGVTVCFAGCTCMGWWAASAPLQIVSMRRSGVYIARSRALRTSGAFVGHTQFTPSLCESAHARHCKQQRDAILCLLIAVGMRGRGTAPCLRR